MTKYNLKILIVIILLILISVSCTTYAEIEHAKKPDMKKMQKVFTPSPVKKITPTQKPSDTFIPTNTPTPQYWEKDMIFFDDFNETEPNKKIWKSVRRSDNYNEELQYYSPHNITIKNGNLVISARKSKSGVYEFTSGLIESRRSLKIKYGRIEVRAKFPVGNGLFSAIWLSPVSEEYLPEIDIMEVLGQEPRKIWVVNHYKRNGEKFRSYSYHYIKDIDEFHLYSINWNKDEISWYIDNELVHITKRGISQQEMCLIINLAVGGLWPVPPDSTTPFPSDFLIDYVKIFKEDD